jgi:hypothetical protein
LENNKSDSDLYRSATDLIDDIFKFKTDFCQDLTILETIIEYGYKKDIPLQELGNIIADHKEYVEILRKTLVKEGYFRAEEDLFDDIEMSDDEW